jgi:MFS family permease
MAMDKNMHPKSCFPRELYIVDLLIVLYALCYQLQAPLEPYLVDRLVKNGDGGGDAAAAYTTLQSFFGLVQMVGSLFVGALIDRLGLRSAFILNFVACAASYGILANVETVYGLYMSKLPTVFLTGFLCAQTAVVKLTKPGADRVSQLGRLTMSYTIGGTIGPSLGGYLGTMNAAKVAVMGSIMAAMLVLLLPAKIDHPVTNDEDEDKENDHDESTKSKGLTKKESSWFRSAKLVISMAWPLLFIKFLGTIANSMNRSISPLIFKNTFHLNEKELGLVMSSIFFGTAVVSMFLGQISKLLGSDYRLMKVCILGLAVGNAAQSILFHPTFALLLQISPLGNIAVKSDPFVANQFFDLPILKYGFISLSLMLALFQFPLATTITSLSTSLVNSSVRGTLVGIEHSLFALAGICGPSLAPMVMKRFDVSGVGLLATATFLTNFILFVTFVTPKLPPKRSLLGSQGNSGKMTNDTVETGAMAAGFKEKKSQ